MENNQTTPNFNVAVIFRMAAMGYPEIVFLP